MATDTILLTDDAQASTGARRDSNGDITAKIFRAQTGLRTAGHLYANYLAKSANFTIDEESNNSVAYGVTTGASSITATLEAAASVTDKLIIIEKVDSGAGVVIIDANGSETIGGALNLKLYRQYDRAILLCNGTGWDILEQPTVVASAVAASTAVTQATEQVFDTSGQTIAANTLRAGDIIEFEALVFASAANANDTMTVNIELGTTTIVTTGAVDLTANDVAHLKGTIQIRTVGAGGTMVAMGTVGLGVEGTVTAKPWKLASTAIDTTASQAVNVTCVHSAASGNSARLDGWVVKLVR